MAEYIWSLPGNLVFPDEWFVLGLVFGAVTLFVIGSMQWWLSGTDQRRRRLAALREMGQFPAGTGQGQSPRRLGAFLVQWVEPVGKLWVPLPGWENSRLETRLIQAGFRGRAAVSVLIGLKILLALFLPVAVLLFLTVSASQALASVTGWLGLAGASLVGFMAPDLFLYRRTAQRRQSFAEGFPDAIDLLVVCVEAGLGLDMAIQRVGDELSRSHPVVGNEFRLLSLELRGGMGREKALAGLAHRAGLESVKTLTSVLLQAEQFGTGVADALREFASILREQRIQRAREQAAKLPVKLIFPIIVFIFPALFLVILGPAAIRIIESFTRLGAG
jgi:tight adherence protein C